MVAATNISHTLVWRAFVSLPSAAWISADLRLRTNPEIQVARKRAEPPLSPTTPGDSINGPTQREEGEEE